MSVDTERHMNLFRDVCEMEATISLPFLHILDKAIVCTALQCLQQYSVYKFRVLFKNLSESVGVKN